MLELDEELLDTLPLDGMNVPRIRLATSAPPAVELKLGDKEYEYQRSYPIKGHSAVMPKRIAELFSEGKNPLVIERTDRFYIYLPKSEIEPEAE